MDWLKGMNSAVQYIEKNLTQPIQYETLARAAGCSVYEFSRIFSFIAGMSVSEYIRRRRLSQAVFDIQNGNEKIIDIALKYCYESPAAFTRAFKELHGTAPLSAKKTTMPLKNYPAIEFVLSIKGVVEMNFKVVEKPAFPVVGIKYSFEDWHEDSDNKHVEFWKNIPKDTYDRLRALAADDSKGFMGIFSRSYLGTTEYIIAVESNDDPPEGFVKHTIQAARWAVFENNGADSNLYERFYTEWLPSSGYKRAQTLYPVVEFYSAQNMPKDNYEDNYDELWFPIDSAADIERKRKEAEAELKKIDMSDQKNVPVEIDLRTMIPDGEAVKDGLELNYTSDGLMVIYAPTSGNGLVGTPQKFTAPIKIELRAKTDSTNLRIYYGRHDGNYWGAWLHLNGAGNDGKLYDEEDESLWINDLYCENEHYHEGVSWVPANEFLDIEWILGEKVMGVKVNGEIRVASCEYEYIEAFKRGFSITGPVYPAAGRGSTVTVKKLRVTEL